MKKESSLYLVRIRWIDDDTECDVLIAEYNGIDNLPDGYTDDDIFFYGMSEKAIKQAIKSGEPCNGEWVILRLI